MSWSGSHWTLREPPLRFHLSRPRGPRAADAAPDCCRWALLPGRGMALGGAVVSSRSGRSDPERRGWAVELIRVNSFIELLFLF